jgi:predicted membrane protein
MNFQPTVIPNSEDHINTTTVFGEIKRTIISKDFKGGKINNLFGSTKLDFTHTGLTGVAVLDISQCFGEISVIVPADWRIESDLSQVFAVVEDNRDNVYQTTKSDKILVIKGTSVFAQVEILGCL